MSIALGALAVVLAGLGGPNPPGQGGAQVTYGFKIVEVRGLDWRNTRDHGLRPVTSRGGVAVWTAPRDFLRSLPQGTVKEELAGPRLTAFEQATAHITTRQGKPFVTQASWRGDDLPPRETTEHVREGMAATIRGRRMDQGILTYLVIEDTSVYTIHTLSVPAPGMAHPTATAPKTATACEKACPTAGHDDAVTRTSFVPEHEASCCAEVTTTVTSTAKAEGCPIAQKAAETKCAAEAKDCTASTQCSNTARSVQVQIPEIGHAEIAGEWLIPRDEVLLVGFGPHTVAGKDGKAEIRERLAVISAEEMAAPTASNDVDAKPAPVNVPKVSLPAPARASTAALPVPKLPSRNLPQGVHADGTAANLPPLPEETLADDPSDGSSEAHASPQSRRPKAPSDAAPTDPPAPRPEATRDQKASRASFNLPRSLFRPAGLPTIGVPNLQFSMTLKPFELRLPMNQKLQLDLVGRVVPDNEPSDGEKD